jgi:hypothetical protein
MAENVGFHTDVTVSIGRTRGGGGAGADPGNHRSEVKINGTG